MSKTEQTKVSATGRIICDRLSGGTETSTAQLTRRNDVLTGSAHVFIDPHTCQPLVDLRSCKFYVSGNSHGFKIKSIFENGLKDCHDPRPDWSILLLDEPVPGIKPYPVDEQKIKHLQKHDKLIVSALSRDFPERKNKKIVGYPKYVTHCEIQDIFNNGVQGTDCGAGLGASGGGCLTDEENPSLVGVIRGIEELDAEEEWAVSHNTTNKRPYDKQSWRTDCVPISGDFLKALDKVAPPGVNL